MIDSSATPATVEREIVRRVKAHTGRRCDLWEVSCAVLTDVDRRRPQLDLVHMSEAPDRRFVVTEGLVAEVGVGFPQLVKKVSRYEQRTLRTIRGSAYDLGDFCVRVGLSFEKASPAGVVVEIEYRPCTFASECKGLVNELMEKFASPLVPPPQISQDPNANAAATSAYKYSPVAADVSNVLPGENTEYSLRYAAVLYVKLLS